MFSIINILRMDFYRFKKNKIMWLLLIIFSVFQLFGIFMMRQYESSMQDGGIPIRSMNESQFIQYTLTQPPSWMLLYIMIFSVYFYMSEYQSGFYKNYISIKGARLHSVISKILILALFTLLMFITMIISDLVGRVVFFNLTSIGDWAYFIKLLTGQFLLHWAFSILILYISMIARNMLISLTAGLILTLNVIGMMLAGLETLMDQIHLSQYLLVNTIGSFKDLNNTQDLIHIFSVAMISILIFTYAAVRFKLKEDLR